LERREVARKDGELGPDGRVIRDDEQRLAARLLAGGGADRRDHACDRRTNRIALQAVVGLDRRERLSCRDALAERDGDALDLAGKACAYVADVRRFRNDRPVEQYGLLDDVGPGRRRHDAGRAREARVYRRAALVRLLIVLVGRDVRLVVRVAALLAARDEAEDGREQEGQRKAFDRRHGALPPRASGIAVPVRRSISMRSRCAAADASMSSRSTSTSSRCASASTQ